MRSCKRRKRSVDSDLSLLCGYDLVLAYIAVGWLAQCRLADYTLGPGIMGCRSTVSLHAVFLILQERPLYASSGLG